MKPNFALPAGMSNAAKRPKIFHGCVDGVFSALLTMVNKNKYVHPLRLKYPLKNGGWKMNFPFMATPIFRGRFHLGRVCITNIWHKFRYRSMKKAANICFHRSPWLGPARVHLILHQSRMALNWSPAIHMEAALRRWCKCNEAFLDSDRCDKWQGQRKWDRNQNSGWLG